MTLTTGLILLLVRQKVKNRRKRRRRQENWYKEVVSTGRKIRREAIDLEYNLELEVGGPENVDAQSSPLTEELEDLISSLERELDEAPPVIRGTELEAQIRDLIYWSRNPDSKGEQLTSTDLKEGLILRIEDVLDEVEERSQHLDSTY